MSCVEGAAVERRGTGRLQMVAAAIAVLVLGVTTAWTVSWLNGRALHSELSAERANEVARLVNRVHADTTEVADLDRPATIDIGHLRVSIEPPPPSNRPCAPSRSNGSSLAISTTSATVPPKGRDGRAPARDPRAGRRRDPDRPLEASGARARHDRDVDRGVGCGPVARAFAARLRRQSNARRRRCDPACRAAAPTAHRQLPRVRRHGPASRWGDHISVTGGAGCPGGLGDPPSLKAIAALLASRIAR
ncbi:MAG: hypothetical protein R2705_14145 [Ilumatobacteraceae bacterium]